MTIKFYGFSKAPSPRRISIIMALKNVPHETIEVDMHKGEQLGDAYKAINPHMTVPAMVLEDGTVLTNVASIATWLEETYPEPALYGTGAMDKADIAGWLSRIEQELLMAIPSALRNQNPMFKGRAMPGPVNYEQIPELAERGLKMIDVFMDALDKHLECKDYIAADQLSVADITAVCCLDFVRVVGKKITESHPNLMRWRMQLNEIDAFKY